MGGLTKLLFLGRLKPEQLPVLRWSVSNLEALPGGTSFFFEDTSDRHLITITNDFVKHTNMSYVKSLS